MISRVFWAGLVLVWGSGWVSPGLQAQLDPEKRQLLQLGYNQSIEGRGPLAGYAYYYLNQPHFLRTNQTLRLAVAPVFMDAELGFAHALGPGTDLAAGLAGGGFADSYAEIRRGNYLREESFSGHSAEGSLSLYHLFNPRARVPLYGIIRGSGHYVAYAADSRTSPNFVLPGDRTDFHIREGFRWGGREPLIFPTLALELSVWHEAQIQNNYGTYGLGGDRQVEAATHLFWGRALFIYTLPELKHNFSLGLTAGTSRSADRLNVYRLGGALPLISEFPLTLPGYYYQEISATQFGLFDGQYNLPLDAGHRWNLTAFGASGWVHYMDGLEQPGNWHSGVGGGLMYRSRSQAWQWMLAYAHGFDAIRGNGHGANTLALLCQFDLEARHRWTAEAPRQPATPSKIRGFNWLFGPFRP